MFKNDSWWQGILIGLVLSLVTTAILYFLIPLVHDNWVAPKEKLYILSIVPNIFFFRWFYKKKSFQKTGHGILIVTVVVALGVLFWLKFGLKCAII
ncbi:MAG: hypothetical protein PHR53_04110 [Bacteroidales bacterium]|nr:hypothetical protein [Bacteroidales bacterium]